MGRIKCKLCNYIIESTSIHEFVFCKCGKVGLDGGHDYLKLTFPEGRSFENSIEILDCAKCNIFGLENMND